MYSKIKRFMGWTLENGKKEVFITFIFYLTLVAIGIELPSWIYMICTIIFIIIFTIVVKCFGIRYINEIFKFNLLKTFRQIIKEILVFIPFMILTTYVINLYIKGQPLNQVNINRDFYKAPILYSICMIGIGPAAEEISFRFIPSKFMKGKVLYIIISSIAFAGMHVVNDPKRFYYIWCYLPDAIYYGYRYYKTKNIWITISLHSFHNLIATLLLIF